MLLAQVVSGDRLNLGLREIVIIAVILIGVALFTKPDAVMDHVRGLLSKLLPFLKPVPEPVQAAAPEDFLSLHNSLTEISLQCGGAYNEPLAKMYEIYLNLPAEEGEVPVA